VETEQIKVGWLPQVGNLWECAMV